jgi:hypothetical protein
MMGKPPTMSRDGSLPRADSDPILSFVETGTLEQRPRLLVDRLLYARALLQSNVVLAPRFQLGECAAAHHILLGSAATAATAADRLLTFGFQLDASASPPSLRFFLTSSHSEGEIRALLVAITMVIRELSAVEESGRVIAARCKTVTLDPSVSPPRAAHEADAAPGTRPPR